MDRRKFLKVSGTAALPITVWNVLPIRSSDACKQYNTVVGRGAGYQITKAQHCILLGDRAGEDITTEDNVFCFTTSVVDGVNLIAFRTVMSDEEFMVMHRVFRRALLNGKLLRSEDDPKPARQGLRT